MIQLVPSLLRHAQQGNEMRLKLVMHANQINHADQIDHAALFVSNYDQ